MSEVTDIKVVEKNVENNAPVTSSYGYMATSQENKKQGITCDVCKILMTNQQQLNVHLLGSKHKKQLMQIERLKDLKNAHPETASEVKNGAVPNSGAPLDNFCVICKKDLTSSVHYENHIIGKKHLKQVYERELKEMKSRVAFHSMASYDLSSIKSCYETEQPDVPDINISALEKQMVDQLKSLYAKNENKSFNFIHSWIPNFGLLKYDDLDDGSRKSKTGFCMHTKCAVVRAKTFYKIWLKFQNDSLGIRLNKRKRNKKPKQNLTDENGADLAIQSEEAETTGNEML